MVERNGVNFGTREGRGVGVGISRTYMYTGVFDLVDMCKAIWWSFGGLFSKMASN